MSAYIHQIATRAPQWAYEQAFIRDRMKSWSSDAKSKRLIQAIYNRSGIETRHSVLGDFSNESEANLYRSDAEGKIISPSTAQRNAVYARTSHELAVKVARQALEGVSGISTQDVTHVIFASCTGFTNPGPDYHIIRELGLRGDVQRYTLGFMGCYAAFPALRMAEQFCAADPQAVVLVVCLELCTLHMQIDDKPDNILANSLFADGAAAAIVSAREPAKNRPSYVLRGFTSALLPAGETEMAWDIGDEGFNIVLSSYVPEIIAANVRHLAGDLLQLHDLKLEDIEEWAVHPGGRSILDKVEQSLCLPPDALASSRSVLADYGNMSSATVLFVLKDLLDSAETDRALTMAMAFGPGLTVETAVLERVGHSSPLAPREELRLPKAEPAFA
ncbi:MAG: type III polyketide synthase [Verrucomicrobiaceae bacterium]|nr:type III polyketide synthase [Verrucomicrobiaceae bacterium]